MKHRYGIGLGIAAVTLATPAIAGDKPLYQPVPAWVKPAPPLTASNAEDAPLLVRIDDQERLADGTVWSYRDVATRMVTPEIVAQGGTVNLPWQPAKGDLIIHKLEILRGTQTIDALAGGKAVTVIRREQQLERQVIDGELTATIAVEGLQVGDVLHLVATTSNKESALGGAVQDFAMLPTAPARAAFVRTRFVWPNASNVRWRALTKATDVKVTRSGGETELLVSGVLPKPEELPDDAPLQVRPLSMIEASSFAAWADVSKVMAPYYVTTPIVPASALGKEVAAIEAASADPLARTGAALQLVQDKVRYLANGLDKGNYVPQPAEQTWTLRYGDCKAKTVLLLALLRTMGIEAEAVAASSQLGALLPDRLPSAGAFDHVLVHATIAGKSYWLDGTGGGARLADLGDTPAFRYVLPFRAGGSELMPLPLQPPARPRAQVTIDVDQRAGIRLPALVRLQLTVHGWLAAQIGLAKTQGGKEQVDQAVQQAVQATVGSDVVVAHYTIAYDPREAVATIDATSIKGSDWRKVGNRYRMPIDKSVSGIAFDPDRARTAWAAIPVATSAPDLWTVALQVHLPNEGKGYGLDGDTGFTAPLAATTIQRRVVQHGDTVSVNDRVAASGADIAPADVTAARARMTLARSRLLAITAPTDLSPRWTMVRHARDSGLTKPILAAYGEAIALDPKEVTAYDNRAAFLVGIYDWKSALPDYDRAIALQPSVERYLRRADAERVAGQDAKALSDLEAAHALDPSASVAELGTYYVDHGQVDRALTMVQVQIDAGGTNKAALIADEAGLLARAGRKDAALAAADLAVSTKAGDPRLLNARCWTKAQLGVQLDTALKDCTKAIELSDSTSAALDSRALVYFRMNRLDDALADLNGALENDPDLASSLYLRGIIQMRQGQSAAGKRDLDAATFIAPRIATNYAPFGIAP